MSGTVAITVTNPAWVAHVAKGDRWASRAFPLISKCDKCAPISPGQDQSADEAKSNGFMVIPTEIWIPHLAPYIIDDSWAGDPIAWPGKPRRFE
jgi:hypothetical protein